MNFIQSFLGEKVYALYIFLFLVNNILLVPCMGLMAYHATQNGLVIAVSILIGLILVVFFNRQLKKLE